MTLAEFPHHFRRRFPDLCARRLLVAVSGGADSVALLHLLLDPSLELGLLIGHVHHGVRGEESDRDADRCRQLGEVHGLESYAIRIPVPDRPREGREAAWRCLRYQALVELARRHGCAAVATGHHRDDIAEGVVLQVLRGAGSRALAGIAERAPGPVIRPLLPWTRRDLRAWLAERGIGWCEDSSNDDARHLRNVVRQRVLPVLEEVSPRVRDHLVVLAGSLAADEAYLAHRVDELGAWIDPWDPDGGIPVDRLRGLPSPLVVRWLHAQCARTGVGRASRRQGDLLRELLSTGRPRSVTLAGRWRLRLAAGRLWLEPSAIPKPYRLELPASGIVPLPLPGWAIRITAAGEALDPGARWRRRLDPQKTMIRSPDPSDVVDTASGVVPLGRILRAGLPRHLRRVWPVVTEDDTITWVPGVWASAGPEIRSGPAVEVIRR